MKKKNNIRELFLVVRNFFLVMRYPFLKPSLGYGIDTYYHRNGYKYHYEETWLDCLPKGWRRSFGLSICEDIRKVIKKYNLKDYAISQVKEKFGILCWYDKGSNEEIRKIKDKYVELSHQVCQCCGKPSECVNVNWIGYFCEGCAKKLKLDYNLLEKSNSNGQRS